MMNLLYLGLFYMQKEIWLPIPRFEQYYEASNLGRIRSLDRVVNGKYGNFATRKGRILKQSMGTKYLQVGLYKNNKSHTYLVHILIANTFHPKPSYKVEVMHLNDVKTDNRAINLKWGTSLENMRSAWDNGLIRPPFAWERSKSKYGKDVYAKIVKLYNTGLYNRHQISVMCNYPMHCIYSFIKTYIKHKSLIDKMLLL